ncbi:MAG TPA: NAD(P)H-hydrate dehydratase [Acidobacteriaceae bacterium]|nr:NAD(P)H-hydrate dehydratase [Acidobacteriaceae bacterium]
MSLHNSASFAYNGIMHVLRAAEMRACDERTVEQYGATWQGLMDNAGSAVARFVLLRYPQASRITVLCGTGNNGGDGMIAARHLHESGKQVRVVMLTSPDKLHGEALHAYEQLPYALRQAPLQVLAEEDIAARDVKECLATSELFLDAMVGTGFRPPLRGVAVALRENIGRLSAFVVSVDLPSGWDADSTAMDAPGAFRSDAVVTFTAPKLAHVFGALTRGPVVVAPIGSPEEAIVSAANLRWTGVSKKIIEQPRALNSNKGRFGHVLVVGGSSGKAGAASMASMAAMRAGAGLVTAAIPRGVASIVAGFAPEMMTLLLDESSAGGIGFSNISGARRTEILRGMSVLAVGPGIGREAETAEFVRDLIANTELPTVLDADGLNAFEGRTELLEGITRPLVLTPHPGEMARLLGGTIAEVERDRLATARKFATEHHLTLVLKGWRTLVAHPDGSVAVNTSGNAALAKGGSGDLLTGMIAALLAQYPQDVAQAVECAVWLHGACADLFVQGHDEHTMLATDLLQHLSQAIRMPTERDGFTWLQEGRR